MKTYYYEQAVGRGSIALGCDECMGDMDAAVEAVHDAGNGTESWEGWDATEWTEEECPCCGRTKEDAPGETPGMDEYHPNDTRAN